MTEPPNQHNKHIRPKRKENQDKTAANKISKGRGVCVRGLVGGCVGGGSTTKTLHALYLELHSRIGTLRPLTGLDQLTKLDAKANTQRFKRD